MFTWFSVHVKTEINNQNDRNQIEAFEHVIRTSLDCAKSPLRSWITCGHVSVTFGADWTSKLLRLFQATVVCYGGNTRSNMAEMRCFGSVSSKGDLVELELSPSLYHPSVWQNFSAWKLFFFFIWKNELIHTHTYMQMILSWTALARSVWSYLDCCLWPRPSVILFASANASCCRLLSLIRLKAELDK